MEYRRAAVGWVWYGRGEVVVAKAVRIRPLFLAVVPDTAFVSDAQRRDLPERTSTAARSNGSRPKTNNRLNPSLAAVNVPFPIELNCR